MNELRITLIQANLIWQNPAANRDYFSSTFATLQGKTDLVILPEMFTTGFSMQPELHAESFEGETIQWLKQQASLLKAAICGSLATQIETGFVNRFTFVTPEGEVLYYDKHHLFRMSPEPEHYQAGQERKIFTYQGWRILPQVCYDLRFPVFMRNRNDYDFAIVVANWPEPRRMAWRTLLQARAIENLSYVVGVNRVGQDGSGLNYTGDSLVVNFKGELLLDQAPSTPFVETRTLSLEALNQFKTQFPAWRDANEFELK
ncbi:amidohydrolase [Thiofilum flexile]|uniref:amidohydrolase n=1 Tax=Thiofilum flexile TaxID=125627 RepID=UPI000366AC75|nr:amidohydrolase [Thiofilum flexile]